MSTNRDFFIRNARLSYGDSLFTPKSINGGTPCYSGSFLLPKGDPQIEALRRIMYEMCMEQWPQKGAEIFNSMELNRYTCIKDGALKPENGDDYISAMVISANSRQNQPPYVADAQNVEQNAPGVVYSGCYVNAKLNLWVQENQWGKKVNAQVLIVVKSGDGDAFSAAGVRATADDAAELCGGPLPSAAPAMPLPSATPAMPAPATPAPATPAPATPAPAMPAPPQQFAPPPGAAPATPAPPPPPPAL